MWPSLWGSQSRMLCTFCSKMNSNRGKNISNNVSQYLTTTTTTTTTTTLLLQLLLHHVPKLATPLASNTPNSVCSLWISTKYRTLHYLSITYDRTDYDIRILTSVLIVTSLRCLSLFTSGLSSICCYWLGEAVVYLPKIKSLHRCQKWPIWAQTLKTSSE